jgi:hypothetical protein
MIKSRRKTFPVSGFRFPVSSGRHRVARSHRHPGHATKQPGRGQPESFRETMDAHRFLGVLRASGLEPATNETMRHRLQELPVTAYRNQESPTKASPEFRDVHDSPLAHHLMSFNFAQEGISHQVHEGHKGFYPWWPVVTSVRGPRSQGGTGSRVPIATQGMQRNNRDVVSQSPFGKPCARMASAEYCEQVGWNRQRMKRCVTGCKNCRYPPTTTLS